MDSETRFLLWFKLPFVNYVDISPQKGERFLMIVTLLNPFPPWGKVPWKGGMGLENGRKCHAKFNSVYIEYYGF